MIAFEIGCKLFDSRATRSRPTAQHSLHFSRYRMRRPASSKPRLALVTRNFPPAWGGMERLNWHMADELSLRFQVTVFAPHGARGHQPINVDLIEIRSRPAWCFLLLAGLKTLVWARRHRPQTILAGSGLTAPLVLVAARASGARTGAYLHGLDITVPHPVYRWVWLPVLRRIDQVIVNSNVTARAATENRIATEHITIVHPGTNLSRGDSEADAATRFRTDNGLGTGKLLLFVGRLTKRKGLREFVADVLPSIVASDPDITLVIVGDVALASLYAEAQTPASIQATANAAGVGRHIRFLGVIKDREQLAHAYQAADVHVFPARHINQDPEGFGMVAIEAAAQGLPTVAYATGGIVDSVADGKSGYLVAPHDGEAFAKAVLRTLDQPISPHLVRLHAERFAWGEFGARLVQALSSNY